MDRKSVSKFASEVMNEFASVIDAEGIRSNNEKGIKYKNGLIHRPEWAMDLPERVDREFVLFIHERFREEMRSMKTLSVDQMMADFNSFLDSNRWDNIASNDGFDALFIDELHLFTPIEREIFHKLIRSRVDASGPVRPPIFMAYDLKQSPNDAFFALSGGNIFVASNRLENSELVKLSQIFRYTPEIANFLADLDAAQPALNIPGEWESFSGSPNLENGALPRLLEFDTDATMFQRVMKEARMAARELGGRRVAVLCCGGDVFDKYYQAASGQFGDHCILIENKSEFGELRHAGKRFVFSSPEYVAGLQFAKVFLIGVDKEFSDFHSSFGARRRFISIMYLGASRAEEELTLASSTSSGGPCEILELPLQHGSLLRD